MIGRQRTKKHTENKDIIIWSVGPRVRRFLCYDEHMRESFEEQLHTYNNLAKEASQPENLTKHGREMMHEKVGNVILSSLGGEIYHKELPKADISENARDAEMDIYKIQRQKQNLMEKFFKRTRALEKSNGRVEYTDMPEVSFDQATRLLSYEDEHGQKISFTKEELFTDGEWGMKYTLDASVPYLIQKEYLLSELKRELREKLDEQIIKKETVSELVHEWKKKAYEALSGSKEKPLEQRGVIAEKMVKNFLKKISLIPGVDFEVRNADVYQDVEQKIDFLIHRKSHTRGGRVEESEVVQDIGIQFTTAIEKAAHKERQIGRVKKELQKDSENEIDDIVLVTMPMTYVKELHTKWQSHRRPGGPEKLLKGEEKAKILSLVLKDILTPEELSALIKSQVDAEYHNSPAEQLPLAA